ncbi:MAG: hypothetical protein J5966_02260, partial [Lachnospiraceae bacterium]|nr:hypothetical protein [Lachnospiraceae bacterium]
YIKDFEKFNGYKFDEDEIDTYIYDEYIWDRNRENEIPAVAAKLSQEQIEELVEGYLLFVLRLYTCDPRYGIEP